MYVSNIKIWNFRKFGTADGKPEISDNNAALSLSFNPKMNVLVGENDSGKTGIIDAIRFLLGTRSNDFQRLDEQDFYIIGKNRRRDLKIECTFSGFTDSEAGYFLEWIHFDEDKRYELKVWLTATLRDNRIVFNVKAGKDEDGIYLDGNAKDLLRLTYLKPLRDAESELSPGYKSRLAQILQNDPLFKEQYDKDKKRIEHPLEKYILKANELIKEYFSKAVLEQNDVFEISEATPGGEAIKKKLEGYLNDFFHVDAKHDPNFNIAGSELISILRKLGLSVDDNKSGLGALNILFIATELLLLQGKNNYGLKLALIEEIEAHLDPQAQLRIISALQNNQEVIPNQFILTTHSTTLASKIHLDNLILCFEGKVFSMANAKTGLEKDDYEFLERFLDATKANLFFAKGVLLVEGDAENILIPTLAELLDRPLHKYGVSIVNVGSKALLRYAKIFQRLPSGTLPIKVGVITDLDIAQFRDNDEIKTKKRKNTGQVPIIEDESKKIIIRI